jgi:hypothetical protein
MRRDSAHFQQKENAHAHKTNLDAEKGDSKAESKVGSEESSKKETKSRR